VPPATVAVIQSQLILPYVDNSGKAGGQIAARGDSREASPQKRASSAEVVSLPNTICLQIARERNSPQRKQRRLRNRRPASIGSLWHCFAARGCQDTPADSNGKSCSRSYASSSIISASSTESSSITSGSSSSTASMIPTWATTLLFADFGGLPQNSWVESRELMPLQRS